MCRSPRRSCSVTTCGSSPRSAASISPRSSRSGGGIHGSPSAAYTSSSDADATLRPSPSPSRPLSPTRNSPYSESFSPAFTAIVRSRMLCALEPVKYTSAAPQSSGGTTRRSTWRPWAVRTEVLVGPLAMTSVTYGSEVRAAVSGAESSAAASTSTSPMVSRIRRSDPAYAHRVQPTAVSAARTSSASAVATSIPTRPPAARRSSIPWRIRSALRSPNPATSCRRSARIASASSSTEPMPSSR